MTCREMTELLLDYCNGELDNEVCRQLREHLDICPPCVTYLETYQITIRVSRQLPAAPMPAQLVARLEQALRNAEAGEGDSI
jgi:anti-sigma factor RsiW